MAAYVSFSSEITPHSAEALLAVCAQLANQGQDEVTLLISSPGGSVDKGLNIYNVLRAMPFKLITYNVGSVNSIANVVFLAGEERYAVPGSTFMFHGVGLTIEAKQRLEEKQLREFLDRVQADHDKIATVIADRSDIAVQQVRELFLEAVTRNTEYALDSGLIHEVRNVEIPAGVPIHQLVLKR